MGNRMRGKTYVYFNGKTEYIGTGGEEQTAYLIIPGDQPMR